ncbi:MAG TPA: hypothetical protein VFV34_20630 [Blastocatellia bacterium]|nr:hypothetical protein [Blastocatellia bacterium]
MKNRIFMLSPARCDGRRAQLLMSAKGGFPLAEEVRSGTASLGEVFAFCSALYFRGKLAYATAFANPPDGVPGILVITPGAGLCLAQEPVTIDRLKAFASVEVDERNSLYRDPLERDALGIAQKLPAGSEVILLGSIATGKYTEILQSAFGNALKFPVDFVGRGDMSRGGLLLRSVESGAELDYIEVSGATRRGPRPPKLPRRR